MATAAVFPPPARPRIEGMERALITIAVMLGTLLQVLDTTIAEATI
jgi:MFS transporter, DHA2 family, multidrug resistance protein